MTTRVSFRRYEPGDEGAINELYRQVTGRYRSAAEHRWQWLSGPAGGGDMWLIHAHEGQKEKLIGHHGIMPLRFTNGQKDLLFGKIENTMVLAEYRSKILYPRFEIRFKQQYQDRYHALFATMGPDAAIRTRKASGYIFPVEWRSYRLATSLSGQLTCSSLFASRISTMTSTRPDETCAQSKTRSASAQVDRLYHAGFLSSSDAMNAPFFLDFWTRARLRHGVAPKRDTADLKWRFWDNPYKKHFALLVEERNRCEGFAIISIVDGRQRVARLEDYSVSDPSAESYDVLFARLARALRRSGVQALSVMSTSDPQLAAPNRCFAKRLSWCDILVRRIRHRQSAEMPRFITPKGHAEGIDARDWGVTGFVFEGRP